MLKFDSGKAEKIGKFAKAVMVPVIMGVVTCVNAMADQKKAAKYEEMEKAFDALNQKES